MKDWRFALVVFFIVDVIAGLLLQTGDSARALTMALGQLAFGAPIALIATAAAVFFRRRAHK